MRGCVERCWRCQQHYHSLHWKKLSQKWLQFIMQLENPRKGEQYKFFSGSSLGNVGRNRHQYFLSRHNDNCLILSIYVNPGAKQVRIPVGITCAFVNSNFVNVYSISRGVLHNFSAACWSPYHIDHVIIGTWHCYITFSLPFGHISPSNKFQKLELTDINHL